MGGCSAINCSNHSRKNHRLFKFPLDPNRRKLWTVNCRRENWIPGPGAQLCSDHFEESQFEQNRQDGWKKLKQTAVPTLFKVPNPPPLLSDKRIKGIGHPKPGSLLESHLIISEKENYQESDDDLKQKIASLENEVEVLKQIIREKDETIKEKDRVLSSFLSEEQISSLYVDRQSITHWSNEAIIKALKIRFALGKHGFNYLRETGYPLPSYSTINRRIQDLKLDFGNLDAIFDLLKTKIERMDVADRNCCLLIDEMEISNVQEFDVSTKSFVGNTTLGKPGEANHYLVVMLRGIKSKWKQIVGHALTGPSTDGPTMKKIVTDTINAARRIGLNVRASTSDMGSSNKALWSALGVSVRRSERKTSYQIGNTDDNIHTIADVPHLLKNMRNAFLTRILILPESISLEHDLPSTHVSSGYIKQLWRAEVESNPTLRSLHHLTKAHLFPTHFTSMNVATAVQLFSVKTAAALEKAVRLKQLDQNALAAAWWIRFINEWFEVMSARHVKCGITKRNKEEKFRFLHYFISVIQETQLGKGWKPLQTGMIMSTLSVLNLSGELFLEGFSFFLPGRLTQDTLENVFGQIRRKSGAKPSALKAKMALRLICLSQFISDIKLTNYASDSDFHLLDLAAFNKSLSSTAQDNAFDALPELEKTDKASTSQNALSTAVEENDIYYIAGSTLHSLIQRKSLCRLCLDAINTAKDMAEPDVPKHRTFLTEYCDLGGLKKPESGLYRICREAERAFQKYKDSLLLHEFAINDTLFENIENNCKNVILPECCKLKNKIINHYLIVRCKSLKKCIVNKRVHEACFGSASASKKQKV